MHHVGQLSSVFYVVCFYGHINDSDELNSIQRFALECTLYSLPLLPAEALFPKRDLTRTAHSSQLNGAQAVRDLKIAYMNVKNIHQSHKKQK